MFLIRASASLGSYGITTEPGTSGNASNVRVAPVFRSAADQLGIVLEFITLQCPWTNGELGRVTQTLDRERAYCQFLVTND